MTRYTHAAPGERCRRCNDMAVRVVAAHALCLRHFDLIIGPLTRRVRQRYLTPPVVPASYAPHGDWERWAELLREAIEWELITDNEARHAWDNARQEVA